MSIVDLPSLVAKLGRTERASFDRLFEVVTSVGTLEPPAAMDEWLIQQFGSVAAVESQRITRVTNRYTRESSLFNALRAQRPMQAPSLTNVRAEIEESRTGCLFCEPTRGTPADSFGRVKGRHALTASNVAKYDGFHGVLVFDEHDPLAPVDGDRLADYFETARAWARCANDVDGDARYYFLLWNVLYRAGASLIHGHMQMTVARGSHYARVEALRAVAAAYAGDYFEDVVAAHRALGLVRTVGGADVVASLTPLKERELLFVAPATADAEAPELALVPALVEALRVYREELGAVSWNLALLLPPLRDVAEDWSSFRPHARLVDRGAPTAKTTDIAAMELYAASVVASDPFKLIQLF